MKISRKNQQMELSPIRRFNEYASAAEKRGLKVYRLNIGQPDIETPPCFMEAIRKYDSKVISYAESGGLSKLKDAISRYYRSQGMKYDAGDIMVTAGGSEALSMVFSSILDPGDEIILPEPFYTNYQSFVLNSGGVTVPVTTVPEEGYAYAVREKLEEALTEKTQALCISNPGNPTGLLLKEEEMHVIQEFVLEHDLYLVADEVYRELVFDGQEIHSFGEMTELENNLVIVDSISKRFSACGARIGCAVTKNRELQEAMMKIAQGRLCVSTVDQVGAAALYGMDSSYFDEIREEYEKRRDAAYEEMLKIPGAACKKPGGAFYMMVKLPIDDVEDFLMFMLTEFEDHGETVMFAPGSGFYSGKGLGRDSMRIAYVLDCDWLRRAIRLLAKGLAAYKSR